ncbi:hypothetical protein HXX76_014557 [Chlamydomonas incerta]|uniref:Uncharacterized protein n=1 Tax=Chlamydomonas incerta TaxID=51695 RepID=A0A835VSM8_CHLIN|nr:hypothetical protein HXX76_014557 [Chlamydomonas incerta]|eukprot:KAG2424348.1 hypothetical protein HXX76_014557 [Chlamydomonas incerta]
MLAARNAAAAHCGPAASYSNRPLAVGPGAGGASASRATAAPATFLPAPGSAARSGILTSHQAGALGVLGAAAAGSGARGRAAAPLASTSGSGAPRLCSGWAAGGLLRGPAAVPVSASPAPAAFGCSDCGAVAAAVAAGTAGAASATPSAASSTSCALSSGPRELILPPRGLLYPAGGCSTSGASFSSSSSSSSSSAGRLFSSSSSASSSSGGGGSPGGAGMGGPGGLFGGGGMGGGGGGNGNGNGNLPPPIIISPVALRVVVIGWMGSNRRYLNKYGALWARSGDHEVLMIRPTIAQTLVRWRGVVVAGRDIDRVATLHRENPAMPTVYHIFSTGGFIHAGTMWRWMDEVEDVAQRRDLLEEVAGIILDSAPAAVQPDLAARAIVSAVTNTPAEELGPGVGGIQGSLVGGVRGLLQSYLQTKGVKLRTEEVYDAWYNLAPTCPQLYLYSDADPLAPPADVERYMGVQEGRGVDVSSHKWADSGHVDHFRRHPHEYAYQISAFLARALRDW